MTKAADTQVLIVGARSTGLTLACVLARYGVDFRIIDKAPQPLISSRAKGFQPRTLEVFEDLGMLDAVLAKGRTDVPMRDYEAGRVGLDFWTRRTSRPRAGVPYPTQLTISTPPVEDALRDTLTRAGVTVERGLELIGVEQDDNGVDVVLRTSDAGEEQVRAAYLVGCDGGHSTVRRELGLRFDITTVPAMAHLAGDVKVAGLDRSHARMWTGNDGHMVALTPLPSTDIWQFQAGIAEQPGGGFPEPSLELFQQLLDQYCPVPGVRLSDCTWASLYRDSHGMVDRHRVGRVFVAGDAAHIHSPAGGLGANTGIQDAYNLGWKLGLVSTGRASAALLDTYHEERHEVARQVMDTNQSASRLLIPSPRPVMRLLRRNMMLPLSNLPGFVDIMLRAVDQLSISYRGQSLSRESLSGRSKGLVAGDRAPDATLPDAATGLPTRLFDVCRGPAFTLLAFGTEQIDAAERVGTDDPGSVNICAIVRPDSGRPDLMRTLVDPRGLIARRYGLAGQAFVLIRPDGYVAFRGQTEQQLRTYLADAVGLVGGLEPVTATPGKGVGHS